MSNARTSSNRGWAIWIGVLVVVAIGGIVAIAASRGDDDGDGGSGGGTGLANAPVEVTGAEPLPRFEQTAGDPAIGMTIPSLEGTTVDGEPLTIEPGGTAKIIVFLAHWCGHCQNEVKSLSPHLEESPMPEDVELVAVSTGVDEGQGNYPPKRWLDSEGWEAPTMADSEAGAAGTAYGLSSFPYFVVVDADGKVLGRLAGEVGTNAFDQLVEAAAAGQELG